MADTLAVSDETVRRALRLLEAAGQAIMSTGSVDVAAGFTDYHVGEGELCRQMIARSRRVTMAVDASKFDRASVVAVASFAKVDRIVTDRVVDDAYAAATVGWSGSPPDRFFTPAAAPATPCRRHRRRRRSRHPRVSGR